MRVCASPAQKGGAMNRIKVYLNRRQMTQRKLAEQALCSEVAVSRYIKEDRVPTVYQAIRIAQALHADVYDVFVVEPGMEKRDGIPFEW